MPKSPSFNRSGVAHEHVHRRQVAVEQLPRCSLPEHLEDPRDLAPRRPLLPGLSGSSRNALRSPYRAYSRAKQ
jgi:hypothetical protein